MKLNVSQRRVGEVTILDISGRLQAGSDTDSFRRSLKKLVGEGERSVILNLEKVGRVDSSGLGELIAGFASFQRHDGTLKLLNLSDSVVELMMMTKLLTVFEVFEDEEKAVESFDNLAEQKADSVKTAAAGTSDEVTSGE